MDLAQYWHGGAAAAYQINQSLRFNSADSAYLNRTPGSAGNRKTWTWSGWVKRSKISDFQYVFGAGPGANDSTFAFYGDDTFACFLDDGTSATGLRTTAVYRDASAWYHIVVALDTTQATSTNRLKIYINGTQITTFGTTTYPNQNTDWNINNTYSHTLGRARASSYLSAYLAEINFIDGSALTPSSFGETDTTTGAWIPKRYTGTYGTNGFYLNFSDNSGTTSTTLGKDSSGNSNNWTPNNFSVTAGAGNDVLSDTPTTNWATLNPIFKENTGVAGGTFANGNLEHSESGSNFRHTISTQALPSSGKVYVEVEANTLASSYGSIFGLMLESKLNSPDSADNFVIYCQSNGTLTIEGTNQGTVSAGDIFSLSVDMGTSPIEIVVRKNNSVVGSNPYTLSTTETLFFWSRNVYGSKLIWNFGQRAFAYTPPTGYKALNTANLPEPTIKDGGKYFDTVLYTGNGGTQTLSSLNFSPDLVWIKGRSVGYNHQLTDSVRGAGKELQSDLTGSETSYGLVSALNSNGFTVFTNGTYLASNANGTTYAAWCWDAGGAGSSNNSGTITSTVSANASAGFSIATYTGNGTAGATIGHGLGVAPKMIIVKQRNGTFTWRVYHGSLANTQVLYLSATDAATTETTAWNSTSPTSTVFSVGTSNGTNGSSNTYVAYCFSEVAGYSKFGSYTGNGSSDGPFLHCGFRPAFVIIKSSSSGYDWFMFDNRRNPSNVVDIALFPNVSGGDSGPNTYMFDFTSNGIKIRNSQLNLNGSGNTYIFAAFAELPFKYANAR